MRHEGEEFMQAMQQQRHGMIQAENALVRTLERLGVSSSGLYLAGMLSILISLVEFVTGLFGGKFTKGPRWERMGVFVGLWVPTFLLLGKIMEDRERMRGERVA